MIEEYTTLGTIGPALTALELEQMIREEDQQTGYANPRSSITYLLWHPKTSGLTTLEILLSRLNFDPKTREIKTFIPPRNSQKVYDELGLETPDIELILRSINPESAIPYTEAINLQWDLNYRGFSSVSYTFNPESLRTIETASNDLKQKLDLR